MSSSSYIAEVLKRRISAGALSHDNPTIAGLSQEFNVSFTPVRIAVDELVRQGWFIKSGNRRLAVNADRVGVGAIENQVPPPGNSGQVEAITNDLIVASLKGGDVYIREEDTAIKYGIGRTVVRRIFSELAGKGLLNHVPYCGWKLRPFLEGDLEAFTEMREAIEIRALSLARDQLDCVDLQRILDGNHIPSDGSAPRVDDSLHSYFIQKSGNRYFADFFEKQAPYFAIFFKWECVTHEVMESVVHQHRAILEPLLAGRWKEARRALSRHIRYSHPRLRNVIARLRSGASSEDRQATSESTCEDMRTDLASDL